MKRRLLGVLLVVAAIGATPAAGEGHGRPLLFAADRSPAVTGEIWRVDLDGRRVDLSRSAYMDTQPAVSPDGRRVAFFSNRDAPAGRFRVFVVGIDGRGLEPVTSPFSSGLAPELAWSPDGSQLVVVVELQIDPMAMAMYLVRPGQSQRLAFRAPSVSGPRWAPNGRELLVADDIGVRAVSPSGRTLWAAAARSYAWSAHGLAAISAAGRVGIYDDRGRRLVSFPGRDFAWSPDGGRIAVVNGTRVQVRAPSGRLLFEKSVRALAGSDVHRIDWVSGDRLAIGGVRSQSGAIGLGLRTGRTGPPGPAAFTERSPDGSLVVRSTRGKAGFAVGVTRPDGGHGRVLVRVRGCFDDGDATGASDVQFTPDGRSLVYQSYCPEPFANLYTAGTSVRRLTNAAAEQSSPAWSPDGTRIAYSQADATGLSCKGCPTSLWVADANAHHARQLTHPGDCAFDVDPSWSPDGTAILVSHQTCEAETLVTVDAATGTEHDLGIHASAAAWGPSQIAYVDGVSVWTATPDGAGRRRVGRGSLPAWSRDGRLAYVDGRTLVVAGRRVPLPVVSVSGLAWAPGGRKLAIAAQPRPNAPRDVFTLNPDGTGMRQVTRNMNAWSVAWG